MSADALLERLRRVRSTGTGRWLACCPAHEDRTPSLSIRELDDGRILLHCFAGCAVGDVVAAVGLELHDLYPDRPLGHAIPPERRPFVAADVLAATAGEALIVAIAAGRIRDGEAVAPEAAQRAALAAGRLLAAADLVLPPPERERARRAAQRIAGGLPE